jgi:hypothetical protein
LAVFFSRLFLAGFSLGTRVSILRNFIGRSIVRFGGFVSGVFGGVFGFAPGILDFAFGLLGGTVNLLFGITGPLADLTFDSARDVLNFSFYAIFIHDPCSSLWLWPAGCGLQRPLLTYRLQSTAIIPLGAKTEALDRIAPLNQAHQNRDNRQHQQDVDKSAHRVGADHPKQP